MVHCWSFKRNSSVDVGTAYRNNNSGGVFIDYISESIAEELKQKLTKAHFYSVLVDGSTDSAISENEAVFVVKQDVTESKLM